MDMLSQTGLKRIKAKLELLTFVEVCGRRGIGVPELTNAVARAKRLIRMWHVVGVVGVLAVVSLVLTTRAQGVHWISYVLEFAAVAMVGYALINLRRLRDSKVLYVGAINLLE